MTQPQPIPNEHPRIADLVISDIAHRVVAGKKKYGVSLQPFNGRSALWDAYEEVLDLAQYLRQKIFEEEYNL